MKTLSQFIEEEYNEEMGQAVENLLPKNLSYYQNHIPELIKVLEDFIENPSKKTSNEDVGTLYRFVVENYLEESAE